MPQLPLVIKAEDPGGYTLRLTFNDGSAKEVDFSPLPARPTVRASARSGFFHQFFLEAGTVAWPNGADVAPETLYEGVKSCDAA